MMTAFVPVLKVRTLAKRWTSEHVPILVNSSDYEPVVEAIQGALADAGHRTERQRASWMLRAPTKVLTWRRGVIRDNTCVACGLRSCADVVLTTPGQRKNSGAH